MKYHKSNYICLILVLQIRFNLSAPIRYDDLKLVEKLISICGEDKKLYGMVWSESQLSSVLLFL